ncbi:MAG: LysR family transcriptional regulator [Pseudomonadota bacterium]
MQERIQVRSKIWLEVAGRPVLGEGRRTLLQAVDEQGSILGAARLLNLAYRKAWGQIRAMEERLGLPLVKKQQGGVAGGGAQLTKEARVLLKQYAELMEGSREIVNEKFQKIFLDPR